MKVYGYEDIGPARGELVAAVVTADAIDFGMEALAYDLGWENAFTSFREAKRALKEQMHVDGCDQELIRLVRMLKARDIPIIDVQ